MLLCIILYILSVFLSGYLFIYWWTKEFDLKFYDIDMVIVASVIGPIGILITSMLLFSESDYCISKKTILVKKRD